MNVLEVTNLKKEYPSFCLDGVTFSIKQGRIVGLIGANGAGKSTTIKGIMNFISTTGSVKIFGKEFKENELYIKSNIGFISGGFEFFPFYTIKKIVSAYKNFYKNWDDKLFIDYLNKFKLDENKKVKELSNGMKVKLSLALCLSHNAKLLILDEPTSGLDPISRDEFCDIMLELNKLGITILFSTHITSDLTKIADDIIYISNGKILANCTLNSLINKYYLVHIDNESQLNGIKLIGQKTVKNGIEGLILRENYPPYIKVTTPTIDEIMIHLEKEQNNEKFN